MFVLNQWEAKLYNINNYSEIELFDNIQRPHIGIKVSDTRSDVLGFYEDEVIAKKVFKNLCEALRRNKALYKMPPYVVKIGGAN